MTRKSKKYQLLVSALLLCFLQVAGIDVYAQSTVTPARKDTTIIQREAPKARARRHRDPIIQDSVKKDSIQIIPSKELPAIDSLSAAKIQIADSLDANIKEFEIEYHKRIAMSFASFILTLIGVSLSSKKTKGGMGLHLGIGLALSFSYILFQTIASTFAVNGNVPPVVAVWIPNILYAFIAFYLYQKAPK